MRSSPGSGASTTGTVPNSLLASVSIGRPGLAVVSVGGGDGIGYVAQLLERALADIAGRAPWTVAVDPHSPYGVSRAERVRFAARLALGQALRRADWVLYNHVGIARTHRVLPAPIRRPYAVFLHGIEVWDPELSPDRVAAMRDARLRISNSHYTAERTAAQHPGIGPVVPCPLGLLAPGELTGEVDHELLRRVRDPMALIVGRMSRSERYKGHDELLDCWAAVVQGAPGAQLVVVGRGDDAERLRGRAAELGLADDVIFTGFVSDVTLEALYGRARLLVMPSRGEGFGLVYLEAMRRGVAVVASRLDAARDVVVDGETGILVDPADRRKLAGAVAGLLARPEEARALGARGRTRYEREFTFERFRDRLATVLADAFGTGRD